MFDFFDTDSGGTQAETKAASPSALAVGEELRAARDRARLSLRDAAEKAGVSRGYLSKAENGRAVPSWDVLVRIAAAYGREPRLRLLSVQDHLEARARAMSTKTPQQRLAGQDVNPERVLDGLVASGVSFVVTGSVAAVLQALPMTIDGMSVSVRGDGENLAALVDMLMRAHALYRELGAEEMRSECERPWLVGWCEVRFDLVAELPEAVDVAVGGLVIPTLPLTLLVASDRDVADVFRAVQNVLAR